MSPHAEPAMVDPRAPRFGQAITASLLLLGVVTGEAPFVFAVALILGASLLSGWRLDLYAVLWRRIVLRVVEPAEPEPAAPHRFAKLLGATGSVAASVALLAGLATIGFALALLVGLFAALAAVTGFCLGCRLYRQVEFFRRIDLV